MRPPQYVGVSGLTTTAEAKRLLDAWPISAPPHSLMLGVLASQKTISGGERNQRSADPARFKDIFAVERPHGREVWEAADGTTRVTRTLNLIHYFTRDQSDLGEQLLRACAPAGEYCDGVQVNVPWPEPAQIKHFLDYGGWERVVLQVGPLALQDTARTELLVEELRDYGGVITDVLLDFSGGRGLALDVGRMHEMVVAVRDAMPDLDITIAGGLCAEALPAVSALARQHGLSLDAEGRLRDEQDRLDLDKARAWLRAAAPLYCEASPCT